MRGMGRSGDYVRRSCERRRGGRVCEVEDVRKGGGGGGTMTALVVTTYLKSGASVAMACAYSNFHNFWLGVSEI